MLKVTPQLYNFIILLCISWYCYCIQITVTSVWLAWKTGIHNSPWSCAQAKRTWLEGITYDERETRMLGTQRIETALQLWYYWEQYPTLGYSVSNNDSSTSGNKHVTKNPHGSCTNIAFRLELLTYLRTYLIRGADSFLRSWPVCS
jgi:hypothetical protein